MKKLTSTVLVIGFILSVVFASCKKDENDTKSAPELPPEASFVMDFSDFSNPDDTLTLKGTDSYRNWGHAYFNVAVWSTIIKVGLAVPVAAFVESFHHEAVYHPDVNNWTWSYNFMVGGITHEAELTGFIVSDTINWEMRITKGGQYGDFLWYYGKNSFDRSGGYWILNEKPTTPSTLLRIDWTYDGNGIGDLKYTNIIPGHTENGGYIFYGTATGDMTRFYDLYNKSLDNLTEIEWNHTAHYGHIKDPHWFGDPNWHCWDNTLMNIQCP
nr:hypothetical protein [Bacteroidota bacterium]